MAATTRVKSLESALSVLTHIPENKSITLTELSQAVGMTKSAVYKILATYSDYGFVVQNQTTKEYSLGPTIISMGSKALRNIDIREIVRPYLHMLSHEFNENSMLMIKQGDIALIAEYYEADVPIRLSMQLGQKHELYYGAAPKVILAYQKREDELEIIDRISFKQYTSETINSRSKLMNVLEQIREDGYCYSGGEFDNAGIGIAVPVWDANRAVTNSIAMNVPMFRVSKAPLDDMILKMKHCAIDISVALGADRNAVTRSIHLDSRPISRFRKK